MGKKVTIELCALCGKVSSVGGDTIEETGSHLIKIDVTDSRYGRDRSEREKAETENRHYEYSGEVCDECHESFKKIVENLRAWEANRTGINHRDIVLQDQRGQQVNNLSDMFHDKLPSRRRGASLLRKLFSRSQTT